MVYSRATTSAMAERLAFPPPARLVLVLEAAMLDEELSLSCFLGEVFCFDDEDDESGYTTLLSERWIVVDWWVGGF